MTTAITFPVMTPIVVNPRLVELEADIERGKQAFLEVAAAIVEIRRDRLYRDRGYETFEAYLKERWGWSRQTGYQYLAAAKVHENVKSTLHSAPPSLTQTVNLAALNPEQQREVASRTGLRKNFGSGTEAANKEQRQPHETGRPSRSSRSLQNTRFAGAGKSEKNFEKVIARVIKAYENRHQKVQFIEVIHVDAGIKVKIVPVVSV